MDATVVYFDGECPLCSREIDHYRKRDKAGRLSFVDIADPHFDARAEGLDPRTIHREMHVRTGSGQLVTAVDAFAAIWDVLPGFGWMAKVVRNPVVSPFARLGYRAFAAVRPYLPKRKRACESGTCSAR